MNPFEVRYNAVEQANLVMIQRLIVEMAAMKGDEGIRWIERFRNASISEISDTQTENGSQRPAEITMVAKSVVEGVTRMAMDRLKQRPDEGAL